MIDSNSLTESDIELLSKAFRRKVYHCQHICRERQVGGINLSQFIMTKDLLGDETLETLTSESFILESNHCLPEVLQTGFYQCLISPSHDFEKKYLGYDLKLCEETFQQQSLNSNWTPLGDLLSLKNHFRSLTNLQREELKSVEKFKRLRSIVNLLITFHYGHECERFMTCAIKLCLTAVQCLPEISPDFSVAHGILQRYLRMIQKNRCDQQLLIKAMKLFYVHRKMRSAFYRETMGLKYVLEGLQGNESLLRELLNFQEPGRLSNLDTCLAHRRGTIVETENFATLVEYGSFSFYSKENWDVIKIHGVHEDDKIISQEPIPRHYRQLRSYQLLRLFRGRKRESFINGRSKFEYLLELLWATITDPFLSEEEFGACVREIATTRIDFEDVIPVLNGPVAVFAEEEQVQGEQNLAWVWYKDIILNGADLVTSPRSLHHLSRCAVRRSLALNCQLPKGVLSLNVPEKIADYILLKDCGDNPFNIKFQPSHKIWWLYSVYSQW